MPTTALTPLRDAPVNALKAWALWLSAGAALGLLLGILTVAISQKGRSIDPRQALHSDNPVLRAEAVRQLGKDGDQQLLVEALEDRDADVRLLAVLQLGGRKRGDAATARILVRCFKDDAAAVRRAAAYQLSWCWRDPEQMRLLEAAAHDDDAQVRATAELASSYMRDHKEYHWGY